MDYYVFFFPCTILGGKKEEKKRIEDPCLGYPTLHQNHEAKNLISI